jgi:APA family basic amino acid/polyamine antiporter
VTGDAGREPSGLLPVLRWGFGVAVIVGGTIGVGVLRTPGTVASLLRDPVVIGVVWLAGGIYALLCANYTAELATMMPQAGGPLVYARRAFGDLIGDVVGLCDWILNTAAVAFLAIAFAEFAAALFPQIGGVGRVATVAVVIVFTVLNALGVRASDRVQRVASGAKGAAIVLFIALCFFHVDLASRADAGTPLSTVTLPSASATTGVELILAFQIVLAAYGGWNAAAYFAEEATSPGRDLPKALFNGALVVCALYVCLNVALWLLLPIPPPGSASGALEDAVRAMFSPSAIRLIPILALVTLPSVINAGLLCGSRILLALGRDGAMPRPTTSITMSGTPIVALVATALSAIVFALSGTFDALLRFYALLAVVTNICLVGALFRLRQREPDVSRPFRTWGYPATPIVLLAVDVALCILFVATDRSSTLGAFAAVVLSTIACIVARRQFGGARRADRPLPTSI